MTVHVAAAAVEVAPAVYCRNPVHHGIHEERITCWEPAAAHQ